jgi:photosystem II stability/assembly factor-like uncharacterized protein
VLLALALLLGVERAALDATSIARRSPAPSKRSRAQDTPVADHMPGGGPDGAWIHSIAIARTRPATVYASTRGGGVYTSRDRGLTWTPADRGLPPDEFCDLTADPHDGATVYASCFDGLFKTVDGGRLWHQLDVDNSTEVRIAPSNPRVVYQVPSDGVVFSRDGGRRWAKAGSFRGTPNCAVFAVGPKDASSLYCASGDGLSVSSDGGRRWRTVRAASPDLNIWSLAVAPSGRTMVVSVNDGRVLESTDAGATWSSVGALPDAPLQELCFVGDSGRVLFAHHRGHIVRSLDGGHEWEIWPAAWPSMSLFTFAVEPDAPDVVYVGTSAGLVVTTDAGRSWTRRTRGMTRAAANVVIHAGNSATLFAGAGQDVFTSSDDGDHWVAFEGRPDMGSVDATSLRSDGNGGVRLRGTGGAFHLSRDSSTWTPDTVPERLETERAVQLPVPVPPTTVARVGRDRRVLIASIGGIAAVAKKETPSLWRSIDDGATWSRVHRLGVWMFSSCCTLLVDPGDPDTVYAIATGMVVGGGGAQEFRSRDAGVSWTELRTPGFTGPFAALPTTPTSLIGQTYQGFAVSRDHGDTWTATDPGPPEGAALVGDARRPQVVFAGTSYRGVYRSFDGGLTWQPTGRVTDRPGL